MNSNQMTPLLAAKPDIQQTPQWWVRLLRIRELMLIGLIIVASLVIALFTPYYLTTNNVRAMAIGMVPLAIIAAGQVMVLVSGGLDLSVGGVMALSGTVVGLLMLTGWPPALAVLVVLAMGILIGLLNGGLVTIIRVNPLIATLGTMTITRGISLVLTEGFSVTNLPPTFSFMGQSTLFGVPPMVWLMLVIVLTLDIALRTTRFFRQLYYIGGNERAAMLSGIRVNNLKVFTYALSGFLSSLAGILLASRLMAGTPTAGSGLELTVIAASVIGGASLMGGEGTVFGAFLGVCSLLSSPTLVLS